MTSDTLKKLVTKRKWQFITFNHLDSLSKVPSEMIFASASGLDPHISSKAAMLQVDRIATARHFNVDQKQKLIRIVKDLTETPQFLILGNERVNVLLLNLETDKIR